MESYKHLNSEMETATIKKNGTSLRNIKIVVLFFVLLCASSGMWAQSRVVTKVPIDPTSSDSIEFFGRIKSVKETSYEVVEKFGEVSKGKINYTKEYLCNSIGNLIEYKTNEGKVSLKYNDKDEIIESDYYNTKGVLDSMFVWKREPQKVTKDKYSASNVLLHRETQWTTRLKAVG